MPAFRFVSPLLAVIAASVVLPTSAYARQGRSDPPLVEIVATVGHISFIPAQSSTRCGRSRCSSPKQVKALPGLGFSVTRTVTNNFGVTGEFARFGNYGTDVNVLLIGARVGTLWTTSSGLGHLFFEAKTGFADSGFIPGAEIVQVGGGAEGIWSCFRKSEDLRCSAGVTAGYRAGLGGQRQHSGPRIQAHLGIAIGSRGR